MDKLTQNLDALLEEVVKIGPPGAGLRVYKGEDMLYERFIGYCNEEAGTPFTSTTICQLASMTKPIAGTACMQEFEKGRFLLTDPVEMFIPEFHDRKVFKISPRGDITVERAKNVVKVGHLLDMTSGITVDWGWKNPNSEELTKATKQLVEEGRYTLSEYARAAGRIPGAFEAGEHFYYGQSLDVAAAVLEVTSGMTFGRYLKENIFDPLGMVDMHFSVPEEKADRVSPLYQLLPDGTHKQGKFPAIFYHKSFESACGGLFGTMEDYCRYALAMTLGEYRGVRLLSDNTIRLMAMNRLCPAALEDFRNDYHSGYGYGLAVRTRMDPAAGSNTSIGEFGWTGGFGSWLLMDPEKKITIVYLHQAAPNREEYVHPRIRNIVYSALK